MRRVGLILVVTKLGVLGRRFAFAWSLLLGVAVASIGLCLLERVAVFQDLCKVRTSDADAGPHSPWSVAFIQESGTCQFSCAFVRFVTAWICVPSVGA